MIEVGGHDDALDQRLSDELDALNVAVMRSGPEALSVRVVLESDLVAGARPNELALFGTAR